MKNFFILILLITTTSFLNLNSIKGISVKIDNLKQVNSTIKIAVYSSSETFLDETKIFKSFVYNYSGTGVINYKITGLKEGEYAFAFYQDINSDNKLNTNMFGYPIEPFCFSNNVKPQFSAPSFSECKVSITETNNDISVTMIR